MHTSIRPADDGVWTAVGYSADSLVDVVLPLAWLENSDGQLVESSLELPEGAVSAAAFNGVALSGITLAAGLAWGPDGHRPVTWRRTNGSETWQVADAPLIDPNNPATTRIGIAIATNEIAVMVLVATNSTATRAVMSTDGAAWTPIELEGFDPANEFIERASLSAGTLTLVATEHTGDGQQSWTTTDAGASWQLHPVDTSDGVELSTVINRDGDFFGVGISPTSGPHAFRLGDDGRWTSQPAQFDDVEFTPQDRVDLVGVQNIDGQLRATLVVNDTRTQVLSDDFVTWTVDSSLSLEGVPSDTYDQIAKAAVTGERTLIVGGSAAPQWTESATTTTAQTLPAWEPLPDVPFTLLSASEDQFTMLVRDVADRYLTRRYVSTGGSEWTLNGSHDEFLLLGAGERAPGEQSVYGFPTTGGSGFQRFGASGPDHLVPSFAPSNNAVHWSIHVAAATSDAKPGTLASFTYGDERGDPDADIALIFSGFESGPDERVAALQGRPGYDPVAICGGLQRGRSLIPLANGDTNESQAVLWVDGRIEYGPPPEFEGAIEEVADLVWMNTQFRDCETLGDMFVLSGSTCDEDVSCTAEIWQSTSGESWSPHPQSHVLSDAGMTVATAMTETEHGIVLATSQPDDNDNLWLVTETTISPIAIGEISSLFRIEIDEMMSTNTHILFRDVPNMYVAPIADLLERVQPAE